jgi:thiol-disulfide isomerase/thioredoxin
MKNLMKCITVGAALILTTIPATAKTVIKGDIEGVWDVTCNEGYENSVGVMDLPQKKKWAKFLKYKGPLDKFNLSAVPFLTVYNAEYEPIYHVLVYSNKQEEELSAALVANKPIPTAPHLEDIVPYTGIDLAALPKSDWTFVEYFATWCPTCKREARDVESFRKGRPEMSSSLIRINADTKKFNKKKNLKAACPVKM